MQIQVSAGYVHSFDRFCHIAIPRTIPVAPPPALTSVTRYYLCVSSLEIVCSSKCLFPSVLFKISCFWLHWVFVSVQAFLSSCGEQGLLFISVSRLLTAVASLIVSIGSSMHGFSTCGAWLQLPGSVWNCPRSGIEPVSPAWAGGFLSTTTKEVQHNTIFQSQSVSRFPQLSPRAACII